MSTYYDVYADKDKHENKVKDKFHYGDDGEVFLEIDVKDIPEGTEKLIFKVW